MSVRTTDSEHVAMYDSVTGTAFGPTFESHAAAEDFLQWLAGKTFVDPRAIPVQELNDLHTEWVREWDEQR